MIILRDKGHGHPAGKGYKGYHHEVEAMVRRECSTTWRQSGYNGHDYNEAKSNSEDEYCRESAADAHDARARISMTPRKAYDEDCEDEARSTDFWIHSGFKTDPTRPLMHRMMYRCHARVLAPCSIRGFCCVSQPS
jgi:hypothetical protein